VELLTWARRVNQQLAAAITGFDDATTPEGADELFELVQVIMKGRPGAFEVAMGGFDEHAPAAVAAAEARREVIERFYREPMNQREELAARLEAGEIGEEALPQDLLMLMARRLDPRWGDPDIAEREALFLLAAGVHTTSSSLIWTLREIFEWLADHPEKRERLTDEHFILRAAHEALRLHPVVPGFPRLATEPVTLAHGTHIDAGDVAVIRSGPASMEERVYGADADRFNPDREVPPGIYPHGLAFGTGPHMCYGMPIVMGTEGLDGSLVYLLKIVLEAGIEADPDHPLAPLAPTRGEFSDTRSSSELRVRFPVRS
jgi:cytochrome P450